MKADRSARKAFTTKLAKRLAKTAKGAYPGGMLMNQTALITGASGGIGYEVAKLFAKDHYNLVLLARGGS